MILQVVDATMVVILVTAAEETMVKVGQDIEAKKADRLKEEEMTATTKEKILQVVVKIILKNQSEQQQSQTHEKG